MKKLLVVLAIICALGAGSAVNTLAETEDSINATVTPIVIAIDILETGPLAYGSVPLGTQGAIPNPTNFTVENVGTTTIDLSI